MTTEHVRKIVEQPIQEMLGSIVMEVGPLLFEVPFVIVETTAAPGFITSDDPCVWYDPANYQTSVPRGAGGLGSPTIEVTLPLSPNQMIVFGHSGPQLRAAVQAAMKDTEPDNPIYRASQAKVMQEVAQDDVQLYMLDALDDLKALLYVLCCSEVVVLGTKALDPCGLGHDLLRHNPFSIVAWLGISDHSMPHLPDPDGQGGAMRPIGLLCKPA